MLNNGIQNFRIMRTQQVVLESLSFSSITATSDVPQGTVLRPLLFILYLNNLPEGISSQVHHLADDDCHELQKDINTLCN